MSVPALTSLLEYTKLISNTSTELPSNLFEKVNLTYLKERVACLLNTLRHLDPEFDDARIIVIGNKKIRVMASQLEYSLKAAGEDQSYGFPENIRKKIHKILLSIAKEIDIMNQHIIPINDTYHEPIDFYQWDLVGAGADAGARGTFFLSSFADSLSSSKLNADHKKKFLSVGLEKSLKQLRKDLTGSSLKLEKVGIVGMAGIGKTTLANLIFPDPCIIQHFDLLVWIKTSQSDSKTDMLLQVLNDIHGQTEASLEEDIYSSLTSQGNLINQQINDIHGQTEASLEEDISRSLKGQSYLIFVDDLWGTHSWDEMRMPFPDDSMGSRILFTGREGNEIEDLGCEKIHQMSLLNEDTSWDLLQKRVFGQDACPPGLVDTGKQIAKKCQGLPLAIVVISGVLLKISNRMESWKVIAETISSLVLSSTNPCQEIFALSYKHLPAHLKSCFLYMGNFPGGGFENESRTLVRLWIAETFITPPEILEVVADLYLKDLIDRGLVLTASKRPNGDVKTCRMHDLLLEFCIKQAREDKFLNVIKDLKEEEDPGREELESLEKEDPGREELESLEKEDPGREELESVEKEDLGEVPQPRSSKEKIHRNPKFSFPLKGIPLKSETPAAPFTVCPPEESQSMITEMKKDSECRFSFHCNTFKDISSKLQARTALFSVCSHEDPYILLSNLDFNLLVVLDMIPFHFVSFPEQQVYRLVFLKYLALTASLALPSVLFRRLKLQTLIVNDSRSKSHTSLALPVEFWGSINLRHVKFQVANYLPPPNDESYVEQIVSLQTLSKVSLSSCSTLESFGRIPNVTKLGVCETKEDFGTDYLWNRFFKNLFILKHLEILKVCCMQMNIYRPRTLPIPSPNAFPESLRKLTLSSSHLQWEKIKILSELPNLEVLKLKKYAFEGEEWETKGRGFQRLSYLLIENTDLTYWRLEGDDCFPRLQRLVLKFCHLLEEVPEQIGNTPSLSSMELRFCSSAAEQSVKYIQEVQEEYGHNIQVIIQRTIIRI